MNISAW